MDAVELKELLDLDHNIVTRLAEVNQGYAAYLLGRAGIEADARPASAYTISGAYWSLLEQPTYARDAFQKAAEEYRNLGMPFEVVLSICAGDRVGVGNYLEGARAKEFRLSNVNEYAYAMMAAIFVAGARPHLSVIPSAVEDLTKLTEEYARAYAHAQVGRMWLPLSVYLEVGRGISQPLMRDLAPPFVRFLELVHEKVEQVKKDTFHWQRLHSGILPVEPEVLATCIAAILMCRTFYQASLMQWVSSRIGRGQLIPLKIADSLADFYFTDWSRPPNDSSQPDL